MCKKGDMFRRIPQEVADSVSPGVAYLNTNTAGGRIRFRTNSLYIAIKAVMPDNCTMAHITMIGQSGFDIYADNGGECRYLGSYFPNNRNHGFEANLNTDGEMHTYTINMPLYDPVEELYIGISENAELEAPEEYSYDKPVVYYGSSITQGGCASRPGNAYEAMISRKLDCDYINLGFSGNGRGEQTIADYMASLDPLVFVSDYDHNAPNPEHLEATHYNLYKTFRAVHPNTPYIMVSKPDYKENDADEKRRRIIYKSYKKALEEGDKHIYYIDGAHIFDGEFRDSCTVDGIHPNDLGFFRMAIIIGEVVEQAKSESIK